MTTPQTTPELPLAQSLECVITWLEDGCNLNLALEELRLLKERVTAAPLEVVSDHVPGAGKMMPEPEAWRVRYRSEPGMIGHYPWSYTGRKPRCHTDNNNEVEAVYTEAQVQTILFASSPPPGGMVPLTEKQARTLLQSDDYEALERFAETCEDGQEYDVPKEKMTRLAELGVVQHKGAGRYNITSFGMQLVSHVFSQKPSFPLTTHADNEARYTAEFNAKHGIKEGS